MFRSSACLALLLVVSSPAAAHADWIFTPHFGSTFGGDASGREHAVVGGALAVFDEDAFGWEADIALVPNSFAGRYGAVDFSLMLSLLAGSIPGIIIGSHIGSRSSDARLRPVLAITLLIVGAKLFF